MAFPYSSRILSSSDRNLLFVFDPWPSRILPGFFPPRTVGFFLYSIRGLSVFFPYSSRILPSSDRSLLFVFDPWPSRILPVFFPPRTVVFFFVFDPWPFRILPVFFPYSSSSDRSLLFVFDPWPFRILPVFSYSSRILPSSDRSFFLYSIRGLILPVFPYSSRILPSSDRSLLFVFDPWPFRILPVFFPPRTVVFFLYSIRGFPYSSLLGP